jgi:stage V sporulation protein SpoVS
MSQSAAPNSQADAAGQLEEATDQAIAACAGDARGAVKALIVANGYLEAEVRELRAAVSSGYARGKFEPVPRDRKDWYD